MEGAPAYVDFWTEVLLTRSNYPAPKRLAAQFEAAHVTRLCDCGCNSFDVAFHDSSALLPLVLPETYAMYFKADFLLSGGKEVELLVFCNADGHLAGVDVQCMGNSEPVLAQPVVESGPIHTYDSTFLLLD